jgi:hypothetical protein
MLLTIVDVCWSAISLGSGKRVKATPKSLHVLASLISIDFPKTNVEAYRTSPQAGNGREFRANVRSSLNFISPICGDRSCPAINLPDFGVTSCASPN